MLRDFIEKPRAIKITHQRILIPYMEGDNEDTPPLLVEVEEGEAPEEEINVKVPITIVTGRSSFIICLVFPNCNRISWGREDYVDELHFK
jgi:hypothetical protein